MAAKLKCNLIRTPFLRFVTLFSSLLSSFLSFHSSFFSIFSFFFSFSFPLSSPPRICIVIKLNEDRLHSVRPPVSISSSLERYFISSSQVHFRMIIIRSTIGQPRFYRNRSTMISDLSDPSRDSETNFSNFYRSKFTVLVIIVVNRCQPLRANIEIENLKLHQVGDKFQIERKFKNF